jgi:hypothetical protein
MTVWYFFVFCYILPRFGILNQDKSGIPGSGQTHTKSFPSRTNEILIFDD